MFEVWLNDSCESKTWTIKLDRRKRFTAIFFFLCFALALPRAKPSERAAVGTVSTVRRTNMSTRLDSVCSAKLGQTKAKQDRIATFLSLRAACVWSDELAEATNSFIDDSQAIFLWIAVLPSLSRSASDRVSVFCSAFGFCVHFSFALILWIRAKRVHRPLVERICLHSSFSAGRSLRERVALCLLHAIVARNAKRSIDLNRKGSWKSILCSTWALHRIGALITPPLITIIRSTNRANLPSNF